MYLKTCQSLACSVHLKRRACVLMDSDLDWNLDLAVAGLGRSVLFIMICNVKNKIKSISVWNTFTCYFENSFEMLIYFALLKWTFGKVLLLELRYNFKYLFFTHIFESSFSCNAVVTSDMACLHQECWLVYPDVFLHALVVLVGFKLYL